MVRNKWLNLPPHHIDTSVFLEPKKTEAGFYCYKYLNLVGFKFLGKVSLFVLGELYLRLHQLREYKDKHDMFDRIEKLLMEHKISVAPIFRNLSETAVKVVELDPRILPMDSLIVANTILDRANLVTIDNTLIGNQSLEKEFKIKITHPKYYTSF